MQTAGSFTVIVTECARFIYNSTVCSNVKSPRVESFIPGHCDINFNVLHACA